MESWMKPVAVVTTVQPYLLLWVVGITFFVTVTLVAVISRGRSWKELVVIFFSAFFILTITSLISTRYAIDVHVVDIEVIGSSD